MNYDKEFDGARAVVTGGGGAIGAATCLRLAAGGAAVAVVDRDREAASLVAQQINEELGPGIGLVAAFECDVTDPQSVTATVEVIANQLGGLNIVINNAGIQLNSSLSEQTVETWDHVQNVNLRGAFLIAQAAEPHLRAHGWGRIVNVSSDAAQGKARRLAYAASKMGMVGLTKVLAIELGGAGVTVNAVAPGYVVGPLTDWAAERAGRTVEEHRAASAERTVVGRVGTPSDIAEAIAYFASPKSGFVTGEVLYVNGGSRL